MCGQKPEVGDVWVGIHSGLDVLMDSREGDWLTLYYTADREREMHTLHTETICTFYKFKRIAAKRVSSSTE